MTHHPAPRVQRDSVKAVQGLAIPRAFHSRISILCLILGPAFLAGLAFSAPTIADLVADVSTANLQDHPARSVQHPGAHFRRKKLPELRNPPTHKPACAALLYAQPPILNLSFE